MREDSGISDIPKKLGIFLVSLIALFLFGTIGFVFLNNISINDAFVMTLESLAFMFHEDMGVTKFFEIFIALFGGFLFWWALWSIFDILVGGSLGDYIHAIRFSGRLKSMKNHYIVAGWGRVGEEIAKRLSAKKCDYVIIEKDRNKVKKIRKEKMNVIQGDATSMQTLQKANIENAKAIVLTLPETETNLLILMLAKELKPKIDVYARADNVEYMRALKGAGAKYVVVPELAAVEKLIEKIL